MAIHKLTEAVCMRASLPRMGDGGGLYLYSHESARQSDTPTREGRSWVFRYTRGKRRREMGLGSYRDVSLAQARRKAADCRRLLLEGIDPQVDRERIKIETLKTEQANRLFADAVDGYLDLFGPTMKDNTLRIWRSRLGTYAKALYPMRVHDITQADVLAILAPIWHSRTETATRVRLYVEKVLDWACVEPNPARWKGGLDVRLPKPGRVAKTEHYAALPFADMPAFWAQLVQMPGHSALALQFLILTAARTNEIRGATWSEVDLVDGVWVVPAGRMKAGREHRVPLSGPARALLEALPHREGYLFQGQKAQLSNMSMAAVLKRMGRADITVHGFRSALRDWASELHHFDPNAIEMCLAHAIGNAVEAAYRRGDLFAKRVEILEQWAAYVVQS